MMPRILGFLLLSLVSGAFAYQGGSLRQHTHLSLDQGGVLGNLPITGRLTVPSTATVGGVRITSNTITQEPGAEGLSLNVSSLTVVSSATISNLEIRSSVIFPSGSSINLASTQIDSMTVTSSFTIRVPILAKSATFYNDVSVGGLVISSNSITKAPGAFGLSIDVASMTVTSSFTAVSDVSMRGQVQFGRIMPSLSMSSSSVMLGAGWTLVVSTWIGGPTADPSKVGTIGIANPIILGLIGGDSYYYRLDYELVGADGVPIDIRFNENNQGHDYHGAVFTTATEFVTGTNTTCPLALSGGTANYASRNPLTGYAEFYEVIGGTTSVARIVSNYMTAGGLQATYITNCRGRGATHRNINRIGMAGPAQIMGRLSLWVRQRNP